jgi:hypothetical protein
MQEADMLDGVATMFDERNAMMKHLKKASYQKNMETFIEKNARYLEEMAGYMDQAEEKAAAASELAEAFTSEVSAAFSKKGKIGARTQADLNFFMIYYVFPAILLTEHEFAGQIADAIRDAWRAKFKDSNISYTTYEKLHENFHEKILGIF